MFDPPIYINVRDRLTPLKALVEWLERAGHQNICLLDNRSTYEPLIDYLKTSPHQVVWLGNLGARALWEADLAPANDWYVYTDSDVVPIEDCPPDAIEHLKGWAERRPDHPKAGLGLYLEDVPDTFPHLDWERSLVAEGRSLGSGAFSSLIDTTFALYRPGARFTYAAIRTDHPYQARHVSPSWYGGELTEEDRYYAEHADTTPCLGSSGVRDGQWVCP